MHNQQLCIVQHLNIQYICGLDHIHLEFCRLSIVMLTYRRTADSAMYSRQTICTQLHIIHTYVLTSLLIQNWQQIKLPTKTQKTFHNHTVVIIIYVNNIGLHPFEPGCICDYGFSINEIHTCNNYVPYTREVLSENVSQLHGQKT